MFGSVSLQTSIYRQFPINLLTSLVFSDKNSGRTTRLVKVGSVVVGRTHPTHQPLYMPLEIVGVANNL